MVDSNYDRVSWVYELLGYIYSGRQIYATKASQIAEMQPGDRVLYVGVGPGEDALLAAQQGAHVTCIDLSDGMLCQAKAHTSGKGLHAEFILGDVMQHDRTEYYDVVVVNFFLNVFCESAMRQMLVHLATLAKPGGKVLISDFMPPSGSALSRYSQVLYWRVTNLFYWLLSLSAWHPIYDYPSYFGEAGLRLRRVDRFRPFKFKSIGFCAITASRN